MRGIFLDVQFLYVSVWGLRYCCLEVQFSGIGEMADPGNKAVNNVVAVMKLHDPEV